MADIAELSPDGKRLEARAAMLNAWHRLLHVHDHLDLNDPESSAVAAVTTLIADQLEEIEGERPRRRVEGHKVELCEKGFVVVASEHAPKHEDGEIVAGAYSQRPRADRVCRHLNEGWTPTKANQYEWPNGRGASPRPL